MYSGINNHLKRISSELFIKPFSEERIRIDSSVRVITKKIESYFDDEIDEAILFGSYQRGTILPRRLDELSDIDILILFNTTDFVKLKPESYRNQLQVFAEKNYRLSTVVKDHPSIVLELHHIKFDLVPAVVNSGSRNDCIRIPNKNGGWMETEPHYFSEYLMNRNKKYNSIVKPIIRLLKYWNATHGYPYNSFDLEVQIAEMRFTNDNLETGFLNAIGQLSSRGLPVVPKKCVEVLKNNADWVEEYLEREQLEKAKEVVARILPGTN